ncbi:MAG: signal peptidase II [Lachnospiraceae bacterium]|nr:signal peptidase II [Lachnospiraceae bacterium]
MRKSFILILCGTILVAIDQLTKRLAMTGLAGGPHVIIDGVFELRYTENRGAAFGMLQNQRIFFIIVTFLALLALIWLYFRIPDDRRFLPLRIIDIFIISGAVGNLIDRIARGYVVDFMYISLIDFPVFNVADIYVSWSAVLALILILFKYREDDFKRFRKNES